MKKVVFRLALLCAGALIVTSCGGGKNMLTLSSLNGEWNITEVDGQKISAGKAPFIGFDVAQKRIYGNSGCNRMMGTFEADSLKPGVLSFGQIGSTRMMCPDMKTEQSVLGALGKVKSYETVSDEPEVIALCAADGQQVMKLEKQVQTPVSLSDLSGEWAIELVNGKKIVGTAEVAPFIGFNTDESRIYGNVGCNTINGALTQDEDTPNSLHFANIATTMMMCPDMATETEVLNALNETKSFSMTKDGKVVLLGEGGNELLTLKKQ
ncbi:META domain-containing protein [Phocaeicola sp.]